MSEENGLPRPLPGMERMLDETQKALDALEEEGKQLEARLRELAPERRRYKKIVELLTGEAPTPPGTKQNARKKPPGWLGEEKLSALRNAILGYAQDHEEFTQADIRALMGIDSNRASVGFEQLRQAQVIRFARQDGNRKIYRLTRAAMQGELPPGPPPEPQGPPPVGVSAESVEEVRRAILEIAEEQEEFSQADVRHGRGISQGKASRAFGVLVDEGLLKVTYESGQQKAYRLA